MKRVILLTILLSLLSCSFVYGVTFIDVGVPDDDIYSGSLQEFLNDFRVENSGVYDLSIPELNTLVYLGENQVGSQPFDYVTVRVNNEKAGKVLYVLLSEEPLVLQSRFVESSNNTYLEFAPTDGKVAVLTFRPTGLPVWQYVDATMGGFGGFGFFGSTYTNKISGKVTITDSYDLMYANYDIETFSIIADNGVEFSKGLKQNYEKYEKNYHGGGGLEFGELDGSIPNPTGVTARVNNSTGDIEIIWTPQAFPVYGIEILGNAYMTANFGLVNFESFNRFESYSFGTSYLSSFGRYDTNANAFIFELPNDSDSYYEKLLHRFTFRLTYYKYDSGVLKMGGTTTVTINVDKGVTVETEDVDGNKTIEEFDKDGNPKDNDSGWFSGIVSWLRRIIDWLQNISGFASGIFNLGNTIFDFIKTIPELITEKMSSLLLGLFVPSEDYFNNRILQFKDHIQEYIPYEYYIQALNDIHELNSTNRGDITIEIYGKTVTIISFYYLRQVMPSMYSWIRGTFFVLLILFHINNIYKFLRGNKLTDTGSNTGSEKPMTWYEL